MENFTTKKISIAGLNVDAISKQDLLAQLTTRIKAKEKTFVVTPYSEFLYASLHNRDIRALLNSADLSIPDGVGILWANLFLKQTFAVKNFYLKIIQAWLQVVWTGASILLNPKKIYEDFPEKIVGADLVWDLAAMAEKNNFSIYILGGYDETDKIAARKLQEKFPNLKIVGTSNKKHDDPSIFSDISKANPDMLLVGLGPINQEKWIKNNLKDLPSSFAVGLGGTFDYIAGVKIAPPKFIRAIGLEWLYRLVTQPSRFGRIINATFGLVIYLVRYKVYMSMPLRKNACPVVRNNVGKILLCNRVPGPSKSGSNPEIYYHNYWQFPQGGIDEGEDIISGAARELFEETSIHSVKVIKQAEHINSYEWNNATRPLLGSHRFKCRGQQQHTVFFQFFGPDDEIKLDQHELVDFKWLSIPEVIQVIHTERRAHAEIVLAELAKIQL